MNLAEMLRGNPLAQQRLADNFAMNKQGDLARMMQQHGTVQDPAKVQEQSVLGNLPIDVPQPTQADMLMGAEQVMNLMPQAGIFAGIGSKTANKLALQKAQDLAGQGVNRKQIWDETGWYNDIDGKWKYEIDDSGAKIDQKLGGETVGANLKHDDLYRAYPGLKRAKLHHMGNPYDVGGGSWRDPGSTRYGEMLLRPDKTASGTKSTALHELQHAIQGREKFGKGGSPEAFVMSGKKQKEAMKHLEFAVGSRRWIEYKKHFGDSEGKGWADFRKIYKSNMGKYPPRETKDATSHVPLYAQDDLHAQLVDMEQNISQSLQDAQDPLRSYYLLAGEAEARNAQTRMGLTPKQRKAKPPWETLDAPEEELLVRMLTGQ